MFTGMADAPAAALIGLKVLNEEGEGSASVIADAPEAVSEPNSRRRSCPTSSTTSGIPPNAKTARSGHSWTGRPPTIDCVSRP